MTDRSELLLKEPHVLKPGVGLLKAPTVIGLKCGEGVVLEDGQQRELVAGVLA